MSTEDRVGVSGFVLLSVLVLGQAALTYTLNRRVGALDERMRNFGVSIGTQLSATDAFLKFTTDGVWIRLEDATGPSVGATRPAVHVIEFADFECPACAVIAPRLTAVLQRDSQLVRLTFKHLPLTEIHSEAFAAALGGVCADHFGRFWEFAERVYDDQESLSRLGGAFVVMTAGELGIDTTAFLRCLESGPTRSVVEGDLKLARRLGIRSTPTFFVNGKRLEGANWDLLEAAVEWELRARRRSSSALAEVSNGRSVR
ncbi:MAG: DsbA family protein [Gemmatimonadales bacterium]